MRFYRIKGWAVHFENSRTRELKEMSWVPFPTKLDGDGYTELVSHANGAAHLGAWTVIIEIGAKCHPRGDLIRDGGRPHDAASLSRISRLPADTFTEVLPRLVEIGWLEEVTEAEEINTPHLPASASHLPASASQDDASSRAGATQHNSTEQNKTHTHTRRAKSVNDKPETVREDAPAACECVSEMPKSKHQRSACIAWAKAQVEAGAKINAYAVGRSRWLDGTADDEIEQFLKKPALGKPAAHAPPTSNLTFKEAAPILSEMLVYDKRTPAEIVAEMPVSDEVATRLLTEVCQQRVEARAGGP